MIQNKVICRKDVFGEALMFFIRQRSFEGTIYNGKVTMVAEAPGDIAYEPTASFMLRPEEAQALMDSMWDAGLRPSEGSGSAGAMAATQKHLEDMRTLIFNPPAK